MSCDVCEAGTYATGCSGTENSVCTPCAAGTWDDDSDPSTECISCTTCPAGSEASTCAATQNTECTPCAAGTWDDDNDALTACVACDVCSNANEFSPTCQAVDCQAHTAQCGANEYESEAPTTTTDRVCSPCTVCENGTFQTAVCTANADTVCEACPPGTYDDDSDASTVCVVCDNPCSDPSAGTRPRVSRAIVSRIVRNVVQMNTKRQHQHRPRTSMRFAHRVYGCGISK